MFLVRGTVRKTFRLYLFKENLKRIWHRLSAEKLIQTFFFFPLESPGIASTKPSCCQTPLWSSLASCPRWQRRLNPPHPHGSSCLGWWWVWLLRASSFCSCFPASRRNGETLALFVHEEKTELHSTVFYFRKKNKIADEEEEDEDEGTRVQTPENGSTRVDYYNNSFADDERFTHM